MKNTPEKLTDLPNVGAEAARWLIAAGICTPAELRRRGAVAAAAAICRLRPDDPPCRRMLAGLEGAVRGIRGHAIPQAERDDLWRRYQAAIFRP